MFVLAPAMAKWRPVGGAMLLYVVFRVELNYTGKLDLMRTRSSFYRRESSRERGRLPAMLLPCYMGESAFVCVCVCVGTNSLSSSIPIKKGRKKKIVWSSFIFAGRAYKCDSGLPRMDVSELMDNFPADPKRIFDLLFLFDAIVFFCCCCDLLKLGLSRQGSFTHPHALHSASDA